MEYYVTNDIPVPPVSKRGRGYKYLFPNLKKGESFVVNTVAELYAARSRYKKYGWKIITRQQDGDVWRIWRVK